MGQYRNLGHDGRGGRQDYFKVIFRRVFEQRSTSKDVPVERGGEVLFCDKVDERNFQAEHQLVKVNVLNVIILRDICPRQAALSIFVKEAKCRC